MPTPHAHVRPLVGGLMAVVLAGCGAQALAPRLDAASGPTAPVAAKAVLAKRLVVGFAKMPNAQALAALALAQGVTVVKPIEKLAMAVVETADPAAARARLLAAPGVQFVESELLPEREPVKARAVNAPVRQGGGDPLRKDQWHLEMMGVPQVWAAAGELKSVTVAVVDTGVDLKHPDLMPKLVPGANFEDPKAPPQDAAGHGTMTAGCVGAAMDNGIGVAGVAPNAKLMPVKVGNSASSVVEAMMWAADHADMITMSLSFKPNMEEYQTAVQTTRRAAEYVVTKKGVPMVCSMGNTGTSSRNVPAAFAKTEVPGLIAVGATNQSDRVTSFSTYGAWTSVSAPGAAIMTTKLGGGYAAVDGTSFSTPLTAGVVALMLGHGQAADPAAIKAKLQDTAKDIEGAGFDDKAGWGRVDAARAVLE